MDLAAAAEYCRSGMMARRSSWAPDRHIIWASTHSLSGIGGAGFRSVLLKQYLAWRCDGPDSMEEWSPAQDYPGSIMGDANADDWEVVAKPEGRSIAA